MVALSAARARAPAVSPRRPALRRSRDRSTECAGPAGRAGREVGARARTRKSKRRHRVGVCLLLLPLALHARALSLSLSRKSTHLAVAAPGGVELDLRVVWGDGGKRRGGRG